MPEVGGANIEIAHKLNEGKEHSAPHHSRWLEALEIVEALILAMVAITTAWSGYQVALWDGLQQERYGQSTKARVQAQETIAQATRVAEREANRIQEEAHARAAQIEQQQVARIQQEAARARAELSRLVVNLSISAAGKVISKSVDSSDNRRLVEEFVHANETRE